MNSGGILTLVAGLGVGCFGAVQWRRIRQQRRAGVAAVGTVVSHDRIFDDGPVYSPVITFVDEGGTKHQFTGSTRTSWRVHRVGQEVPVTYPPGQPGAAKLSSATHVAVAAGLPLAFGVVFAVLGLLGLLRG
jgi:hypothetical protein